MRGRGDKIPPPAGGCGLGADGDGDSGQSLHSPAVMLQVGDKRIEIPFKITGAQLVATCTPGNATSVVLVNADSATCFLYGPAVDGAGGYLPAPPLSLPCAAAP